MRWRTAAARCTPKVVPHDGLAGLQAGAEHLSQVG
jgi:hypothetical protein